MNLRWQAIFGHEGDRFCTDDGILHSDRGSVYSSKSIHELPPMYGISSFPCPIMAARRILFLYAEALPEFENGTHTIRAAYTDSWFPECFFCQPATEESPFKQGNNDKENVRKKDKDERRDQDPGVFLPGHGSFTDKGAHARKIE